MKVLAVIPVRGGSKGIPRKNIRSMAGKPLLQWSIEMLAGSRHEVDIVVSSEDDEILMYARQAGARTLPRPPHLAQDSTTLDPVIHHAYQTMIGDGRIYDLVATVQATSPLLKTESFDSALERMAQEPSIDSLISGVDDTHLTWRLEGDVFVPNYVKRLNRQQLPKTFRETGGFFLTRPRFVTETSRMGQRVQVYQLPPDESIDIDSYEDWNLCELLLKKRKVLFVVLGNREFGMGHVYRSLMLAQEFPEHAVEFLALKESDVAYDKISSAHFPCHRQQSEETLLQAVLQRKPDVIIHDILDTEAGYIRQLKEKGKTVVNFEDLGTGVGLADLVFNELYPEHDVSPNVFSGHEFFCLRDEFLFRSPRPIQDRLSEILVTFGGTDPLNLTARALDELSTFCHERGIRLRVILGLGYSHAIDEQRWPGVEILRNTPRISEFMAQSDLALTSAGRTVYEVASLGLPAVVIAQNERELSHYFAHPSNGFVNLGGGWSLNQGTLRQVVEDLANNPEKRRLMQERQLAKRLTDGKKRVVNIIKAKMGGLK